MAIESTIGGEGRLFIGEDKRLRWTLQKPTDWNDVIDGVYTVPDMAAWALLFVVRKLDGSSDPATLSLAVTGFGGTHNADPDVNTQFAYLDLTDDHTNLLRKLADGALYRWSLKRMDDTSETVLGYGDIDAQLATAR